jgi:hypothetical protein
MGNVFLGGSMGAGGEGVDLRGAQVQASSVSTSQDTNPA